MEIFLFIGWITLKSRLVVMTKVFPALGIVSLKFGAGFNIKAAQVYSRAHVCYTTKCDPFEIETSTFPIKMRETLITQMCISSLCIKKFVLLLKLVRNKMDLISGKIRNALLNWILNFMNIECGSEAERDFIDFPRHMFLWFRILRETNFIVRQREKRSSRQITGAPCPKLWLSMIGRH